MGVHHKRVRPLNNASYRNGTICYLMSREQRTENNWALIHAYQQAVENNSFLIVAFALDDNHPKSNFRNMSFMLEGLSEVQKELKSKNIPFVYLIGNPIDEVIKLAFRYNIGMIITDFDPLKHKVNWRRKIAQSLDIPVFEVDAHNIVPAFYVTDKQEYGAYTIRGKIKKLLPEFLDTFPKIEYYNNNLDIPNDTDLFDISNIKYNGYLPNMVDIPSGSKSAISTLKHFLENNLERYSNQRNDPSISVQSNLSPYLHFGQLSAQQVALEVINSNCSQTSKETFLEELIIRKELSDNYCLHNPYYDNFDGFTEWAKDTLNEHRTDKRDYEYNIDDFENCNTCDIYWNTAQTEMMKTGKMHGYMRMYWCKKILEWSNNPENAINAAIYLNDKYSIDGSDPNGYTGIAWSIGGLHDRPWKERKIYGKIRYMNAAGLERKFDMKKYVNKIKKM